MMLIEYIKHNEEINNRLYTFSDFKILSRSFKTFGDKNYVTVEFSALKQSIIDIPEFGNPVSNNIWTSYKSHVSITLDLYQSLRRDELINECLDI